MAVGSSDRCGYAWILASSPEETGRDMSSQLLRGAANVELMVWQVGRSSWTSARVGSMMSYDEL